MKLIQKPLTSRQSVLLGIVGTLAVIAVWQTLYWTGLLAQPGLPDPVRVVAESALLLVNGPFWIQISFTIAQWLLGLAIATVLGVAVGTLMGAFRRFFIAFQIPVELFRSLPAIAIAPLLVLILGNGILPMALTVAFASVWPILLNTMYGVQAADATAVATGRSFRMTPTEIMTRIKMVSGLPFAFTGVRIAASIGLIVAVSAELLVGTGQGIGGYILVATANATDLSPVYAAALIAGVLGALINVGLAAIDTRFFAWKQGLAQ